MAKRKPVKTEEPKAEEPKKLVIEMTPEEFNIIMRIVSETPLPHTVSDRLINMLQAQAIPQARKLGILKQENE